MKSKYINLIISIVLILSLCLAFGVPQAGAVSEPIVVGGTALAVGGIAWAIASAMGVHFDFSQYTSQTIGTMFDPFYNVATTLQTSDFALIKGLRSGYDALRLSLTAYNAIKAGSENIITDNNIQDNETGIVEYSSAFEVPLNVTFGSLPFAGSIITPDGGTITATVGSVPRFATVSYTGTTFGGNGFSIGSYDTPYYPIEWKYIETTNHGIQLNFKCANRNYWQDNYCPVAYNIPVATVDLDYESGIVNIDYGEEALDNVTIVFPQNPLLTPTSDIDAIVNYINQQAATGDLAVEVDAVPPPPIPTDALGEIPFNTFLDVYGGSVFEEIDNQTQVIDTLGQSIEQYIQDQTDVIDTYGQSVVESIEDQTEVIDTAGQSIVTAVENQSDVIDTVGQDVVDAIESVDTNIQTGTGILSGIRTLVDSAVDTLEDIGEMVRELVDDIVLGTETLISGILNQIPSLFNVILSPIKTAASIWHYVVEWIQSITGPFQFIWSMANGTSYYIVLPVYASLAAAVVLAFYKRFGK